MDKSARLLHAILNAIDVDVLACDRTGHITFVNRARQGTVLGVSDEAFSALQSMPSYRIFDALTFEPKPFKDWPLVRAWQTGEPVDEELIVEYPPGQRKRLFCHARALFDTEGQRDGAVVVAFDLAKQPPLAPRLDAPERQHLRLMDALPVLLAYIDVHQRLLFANRTHEEWFGKPLAQMLGSPLRELLGASTYAQVAPSLQQALQGTVSRCECEIQAGEVLRSCLVSYVPDRSSVGTVMGLYVLVQDISERKQLEHELRRDANHDVLTGLPNRRLFDDRLQRALNRASRGARGLAMLLVDLDGFKPVNDTYGHGAGDALLCQVAARLTGSLRAVDTVARLGGDEFAIVMEGMLREQDVIRPTQSLLDALGRPYPLGKADATISASIGVCFVPAGGTSEAAPLLAHADAALYEAKRAGRNRYALKRYDALCVVRNADHAP